MSNNDRFVAHLLEAGAGGFAGLSASLLLERHPEIAERYDPGGFANWKAALERWLLDLSAALDLGEPKLFEARMRRTRRAFVARGAYPDEPRAALVALRDTLRERLPDGSAEVAVAVVDRALGAVAAEEDQAAGEDLPPDRRALSYMAKVLEGRPREAIDELLGAVDAGTSVAAAYLQVLMPAQREVGRLWHSGELTIAEEHLVTATTQRAMTLLSQRVRPTEPKDKTAVVACVAGNIHDMGVRAICDFFEMAGWRAVNLGSDNPDAEIVRSVEFFDADVVVLAATLDPHLKAVRRTIERIRALKDGEVKIIVGGPAFEAVTELWCRVGADGLAAGLEDAEPLASRLVR